MEEILFTQIEPEPMMVKTEQNLYMVYADGKVALWDESRDEFMSVDKYEISKQFIRNLRYSSFPSLFPQP